jgi:hypothetical protein
MDLIFCSAMSALLCQELVACLWTVTVFSCVKTIAKHKICLKVLNLNVRGLID